MIQPPPTQTTTGQTHASATVYVSGDAPEVQVIVAALRLATLRVVELGALAPDLSSIAVRPCVLLADRSGEPAQALLRGVAELTDADRIEVVLVQDEGAPSVDLSALPCAVHAFARPVDVAAAIARISALVLAQVEENAPPSLPPDPDQGRLDYEPANEDTPAPLSSPTPMGRIPAPSPRLSYAPAQWPGSEVPSSSSNPPLKGWPSSTPPALAAIPARRAFAGPTSVSPDLEGLLSSAEHRVFSEQRVSSDVPTPEEEVNAVLPPDVLAALDEPIDAEVSDDDDEDQSASHTPVGGGTTGSRRGTGTGSSVAFDAPVEPVTATGEEDNAGGRPHTTGAHPVVPSGKTGAEQPMLLAEQPYPDEQPPTPQVGKLEVSEVPAVPEPAEHVVPALDELKQPWPPQVSQPPALARSSRPSGRPSLPPVITSRFDGLQWLASCAASRTSGSVCFDDNGVQRRAVMRDGDFVTCASSSPDESLVAHLLERGELPRDVMAYMAARVPPFGRHAAAALIATGFLAQDQLWGVLRAHAEWVLSRMLRTRSGVGAIEGEPPGRLKAEPSVFGGATGAEVLVEVCRRSFSVEEAIARLGGGGSTLAPGHNASLLAECALDDQEHALVAQLAGASVQEAIERAGQPEFATVLCALVPLGVVEVLAGLRPADPVAMSHAAEAERLDAEAVRKRVQARLAVIEEGDWFQVLGVPRTATSYEIRRAFLESRRAFEPSRLLSAATADLADDVQLVVQVLEEAYDVLRDEARRTRYLKALEASPPSVR